MIGTTVGAIVGGLILIGGIVGCVCCYKRDCRKVIDDRAIITANRAANDERAAIRLGAQLQAVERAAVRRAEAEEEDRRILARAAEVIEARRLVESVEAETLPPYQEAAK
jgi:hypothetical protein